MDWVTIIVLFVGGVLAASGFIVSKKPNAKEMIDKLVPYQGWIGVVMLGWGLWWLLTSFRMMGIMSVAPVAWIVMLVTSLTLIGVGFLLGFGMISKWMGKSPEAVAKGQELRAKLVRFTTPLGFVSIALSVLLLLWSFHILPAM